MTPRAWIVGAALAILACGGTTEPPGPTPGVVVAVLSTPNDADGALVVRIIGPQTELKAAGSYHLAAGTAAPSTTTRVILSGAIGDGDLLEFKVSDVSKVATYAVVVEQAAARNTYALLDPTGYTVTLRVK